MQHTKIGLKQNSSKLTFLFLWCLPAFHSFLLCRTALPFLNMRFADFVAAAFFGRAPLLFSICMYGRYIIGFFCSCHNCVSLHSNERIYAKAFVLLYSFSIVYVYICIAFCLFKFIYNLFIFIIIIPSHPLAVLAGAMIDFVFFCTILLFSSFRRYNLYAYRFEQVHEICSFSTVAIATAFRVVYLCVLEAIN